MCFDAPTPPPPPDPMATAKAQGAMNKETAIAQAGLNSTNQVTPTGNLTYTQNGTWADGTPQFTATTSLSPEEQAIFNTNQGTKQNIATIGNQQSARIGDLLGKPLDINQAVADKITALGSQRLDPKFAQGEEALRTRLANSGIRAGSAAFDAELRDFNAGKNDAYNSLYLGGNQQAESQAIAERNQPINEITALMSGSQVSNPTFQNTPNTPVAGVDYTGLVNNNYNAATQQYNTQLSQQNAAMGGMFGLAGSLGGMGIYKYSDRRLKKNIHKIGKLDNNLPVYSFNYKSGGPKEIGVMAQDVEKQNPAAVVADAMGRKMVDYSKVEA